MRIRREGQSAVLRQVLSVRYKSRRLSSACHTTVYHVRPRLRHRLTDMHSSLPGMRQDHRQVRQLLHGALHVVRRGQRNLHLHVRGSVYAVQCRRQMRQLLQRAVRDLRLGRHDVHELLHRPLRAVQRLYLHQYVYRESGLLPDAWRHSQHGDRRLHRRQQGPQQLRRMRHDLRAVPDVLQRPVCPLVRQLPAECNVWNRQWRVYMHVPRRLTSV